MIFQSDEDRAKFALSTPLLLVICNHLEHEFRDSRTQLELISFDEHYAYVTTSKDADLVGPCDRTNAAFRRNDKIHSCQVYNIQNNIIQVLGTSPKDLAYVL